MVFTQTAFSFVQHGSCYCHQDPSDIEMLKIPQWALKCAGMQAEPLLVTVLLSDRPTICIHKLAKQPQHSASLHVAALPRFYILNRPSGSQRNLPSQAQILSWWAVGKDMAHTIQLTCANHSWDLPYALREFQTTLLKFVLLDYANSNSSSGNLRL